MRIIGGTHKGRKLRPPKKLPVRPTTDFAKEGLFNLLQNRIDLEGIQLLDLCAGTGNISLEFASRGAEKIVSVDQNAACLKYIREASQELGFENIQCIRSDIFKYLKGSKLNFDLIFADPPYADEKVSQLADLIFDLGILREDGIFILEHSAKFNFENHPRFESSRKYGNVNFTFFQ